MSDDDCNEEEIIKFKQICLIITNACTFVESIINFDVKLPEHIQAIAVIEKLCLVATGGIALSSFWVSSEILRLGPDTKDNKVIEKLKATMVLIKQSFEKIDHLILRYKELEEKYAAATKEIIALKEELAKEKK